MKISKLSLFNLSFFLILVVQMSVFSNELILSIPKSGTNLAIKAVKLITGKKEHFHISDIARPQHKLNTCLFWTHETYCPKRKKDFFEPTEAKFCFFKKRDFKIILVLRNPKELVCACEREVNFKAPIREIVLNPGKFLNAVTGKDAFIEYKIFSQVYRDLLKWTQYPNVYVFRYESFVGLKGGGSKQLQVQEVLNLAEFLNVELTHEEAGVIADQLYGNTRTFKNGQIDSWKTRFSKKDNKLFDAREGDLLLELGYKG